MTSGQFWWQWAVSFAVAVGTVGTVIVALFGKALRAKLFPSRLDLTLLSTEGEPSEVRQVSAGGLATNPVPARYYHLLVSNSRRWSSIHGVQVFLTRVEEPGPQGRFQACWQGEVPMRWRHQEAYPVMRTIGAPAHADLCFVVKGSDVSLEPLFRPFTLRVEIEKKKRIRAFFQARGDEGDSEVLCVEIAWAGTWRDGAKEMAKSLAIEVVKATAPV
ncbi:MAG: hypothetical protein ACRELB_24850 [Polyangiaceae bacterium]